MSDRDYPTYRSHYLPRTAVGRRALWIFVVLFLLVQPPAVYVLANRVEPFVLGMPFLYTYLLILYAALNATLIWLHRRDR